MKLPKTELTTAMGARLRTLREIKGLTQEALAEIMGVGVSAISMYEGGRNAIDIIGLAWAAEELSFTTDYVISGDKSGLRFDLALRIQERERTDLAHVPARRGRPRKPRAEPVNGLEETPKVRDVPYSAPGRRRRPTLHEPQTGFIAQPSPKRRRAGGKRPPALPDDSPPRS